MLRLMNKKKMFLYFCLTFLANLDPFCHFNSTFTEKLDLLIIIYLARQSSYGYEIEVRVKVPTRTRSKAV